MDRKATGAGTPASTKCWTTTHDEVIVCEKSHSRNNLFITAEGRRPCRAPGCWRPGSPVRIEGENAEPVMVCRTHRKAYFGSNS